MPENHKNVSGKCAHDGCNYRVAYDMVGREWVHTNTHGYTPSHEAVLDFSLLPDLTLPDGSPFPGGLSGSYALDKGDEVGFENLNTVLATHGKRLGGLTTTWLTSEFVDGRVRVSWQFVPAEETPSTTGETRMTNATTGAQKGAKAAKYNLIPVGALEELAKLYGFGATKYAPRNWEKGYELSLSYDALQRHANQWWNGEDTDSETQLSHMASVAWHAFTLYTLLQTHPEMDDRPKKELE